MSRNKFLIVFLIFAFFVAGFAGASTRPVYPDLPLNKIVDDSSIRVKILDTWLNETVSRLENRAPQTLDLPGGGRVRLSFTKTDTEYMIVLARELYGPNRRPTGNFPGWAQGSWVIVRRLDGDESGTRIRVFLRSDPYVYVQFRPFSRDKSLMDAIVYDGFLMRSMPIPVPFSRLEVMPVRDVLAVAGDRFPIKYFDIDPALYADSQKFVTRVRAELPLLEYADDGALDEDGRYVFIESGLPQFPDNPAMGGLNCSGFVKWVTEGIIAGLVPDRYAYLLKIANLKKPFGERGTSFSRPWEESTDPFFGLDWCRNLASVAGLVTLSPVFAGLKEFEVNSRPFSEIIDRRNTGREIQSYPDFQSEAGFAIEGLHALLYTLAVNEPNRVYLAAVNNETGAPTTAENPRGLPRMRQYFHTAVLVPYFTESGAFRVVVFESAAENSITSFIARYPGCFVNLSRVALTGKFYSLP